MNQETSDLEESEKEKSEKEEVLNILRLKDSNDEIIDYGNGEIYLKKTDK